MSVEARKWAKTHTVGNATAKAVLLAIADYADEHGSAFPSQRALAEYTEFKPRAIRQAMALLEDLKLLRCEERRRQDGGRTSDRLILELAVPPVSRPAAVDESEGSVSRAKIAKTARFEVFKRDGFACQYCGRKAPSVVLECDHIVPRASGGKNRISNLITACSDCNSGKGDRALDEVHPLFVGNIEADLLAAEPASPQETGE